MALSVEASELVEIFQWLTPEQAEAIMSSSESEHVKEEMADIMIYLIRMADKLNVDLEKSVADKTVNPFLIIPISLKINKKILIH